MLRHLGRLTDDLRFAMSNPLSQVIDLCDSVPDTDLEDEDDDTQEMMILICIESSLNLVHPEAGPQTTVT